MTEYSSYRRRPKRVYSPLPENPNIISQSDAGEVIVHPDCNIGDNVRIIPSPGQTVTIERNVSIGSNSIIYAKSGLVIPEGVRIGDGVLIMDRNLHGIGGNVKENHQLIVIEPGVSIGKRAIILKGAHIDKDIPPFAIQTCKRTLSDFSPNMLDIYDQIHTQIEAEASPPDGPAVKVRGDANMLRYSVGQDGIPGFNAYPSTTFHLTHPLTIGYQTFFNIDSHIDTTASPVHIGDNCSIAFSTYIGATDTDQTSPTIISDQVWIGAGAIVMAGVTIGKGSMISAGAIVTQDVAEFSIVGDRPGRILQSIPTFTGSHGERPGKSWAQTFI